MTRISGAWYHTPQTEKVTDMLEAAGHKALFVGGCVRNALLNRPVSDIDLSTDALPETVMELAENAGLRALPTGIDHGTVTVISGHIPHEITTFRKDVETDGRRAVVAYSTHMEDDAHRRDFTMNAIYADSRGTILDPLGGLADLRARRVRFIDDPGQRIREDYLRILRFFRFHAHYGCPESGMDPDALDAIARNLDGLQALSRERVGAEVKKLLAAPDPSEAVAAMAHAGVLGHTLPGADHRALAPLVHHETEAGLVADPIRRLAALGGVDVAKTLRLSKAEARRLARLTQHTGSARQAGELGYRLGADEAIDVLLLRAAVMGTPVAKGDLSDVRDAATKKFPVRAGDLDRLRGPAIGAELKRLEALWIASGFRLSREALLQTPGGG